MRWLAVALLAAVLAGCVEREPDTVAEQVQADGALTVHVHFEGQGPDEAAQEAARAELEDALGLPVQWFRDPIYTPVRAWNADLLAEQVAQRHDDVDPHLHVLWVHGSYPDADGVPAIIFLRPDPVVAVFADVAAELPARVAGLDRGMPSNAAVHRVLLLHAVGHGLGLTDCGLPATSSHADGTCHNQERDSVMHSDWGHLSGWVDRAIAGSRLPTGFSDADRADLRSLTA